MISQFCRLVFSKRTKNISLEKEFHTNAHSKFIHIGQKLEATQMTIHRKIHKPYLVFKIEWPMHIYNSVQEANRHAEKMKLGTKSTCCMYPIILHFRKIKSNLLWQKSEEFSRRWSLENVWRKLSGMINSCIYLSKLIWMNVYGIYDHWLVCKFYLKDVKNYHTLVIVDRCVLHSCVCYLFWN